MDKKNNSTVCVDINVANHLFYVSSPLKWIWGVFARCLQRAQRSSKSLCYYYYYFWYITKCTENTYIKIRSTAEKPCKNIGWKNEYLAKNRDI